MRVLRPIVAGRLFVLGFAAIALIAVAAGPPSNPRADSTETLPAPADPGGIAKALAIEPDQVVRTVQTVGLFALISLAPAAVLMLTSFVRIHIVLILLRQALGSPQVPGNQVITALALLLTALVMRPVVDVVYTRSIKPYSEGRITPAEAWQAGSRPVQAFMIRQIEHTHHQDYLVQLQSYAVPRAPGQAESVYSDEFPFRVVAAAYLLSELTTALVIGFSIYLPFLVIDLVVSAVLAAMGLFMLPPALVSLPLKLILFVLADGWLRVATMLLQTFADS